MQARDYLRQPGLHRAFAAARTQLERLDRVGGTVILGELSEEEASALAGLLGSLNRRARPRPGRQFRVFLRDLDAALRASRFALSLPDALELIGPALDPRPQQRARERARAQELWERATAHPLCSSDPRAHAWVGWLRARGALPRTDGHRLLAQALDLGLRLPVDPPVERTRLAAEFAGDPHALDDDRPLSRLLLGQLAFRADDRRPETARERRVVWQRFGVLVDAASADVLTLGLRPLPGGPLARALTILHGWHFRLTLGQLAREPLRFAPGLDLYLCENVTVLTAAEARHGSRCAPLLCFEGWPSSAGWALFDTLAAAGATFHYHGDFDWDGVRIAELLYARMRVEPWRFQASDYRAGIALFPERTRPIDGRVAAPGRQSELVAAMLEERRELHEEAVLEDLLGDLAGSDSGELVRRVAATNQSSEAVSGGVPAGGGRAAPLERPSAGAGRA